MPCLLRFRATSSNGLTEAVVRGGPIAHCAQADPRGFWCFRGRRLSAR